MSRDLPEVVRELDPRVARGLVEGLVQEDHRSDAGLHFREHGPGLGLPAPGGLQPHQARDQSQVVLDPVVCLLEQSLLFAKGGFEGPLRLLPVRDLLLHRDEVTDLPVLILHPRDGRVFPVQFAILATVAQLPPPFAALGDDAPQVRVGRRGSQVRLQDAGVFPEGLGPRVAGGLLEIGVDVLHVPEPVGDDDGGRALLHRARHLTQTVRDGALLRLEGREFPAQERQFGVFFGGAIVHLWSPLRGCHRSTA